MFGAINPYMLYIKIGCAVLALLFIVGVFLYVKSVFVAKDNLLSEVGKLRNDIITEQTRAKLAQEQLVIWQDTVKKMNLSMKNIKVVSNNYIKGVENAKPYLAADGTIIPLVMSGSSAETTLPRFENSSTNRRGANAPPS